MTSWSVVDPNAPRTGITAWQFPEWFIAQGDEVKLVPCLSRFPDGLGVCAGRLALLKRGSELTCRDKVVHDFLHMIALPAVCKALGVGESLNQKLRNPG